MLVLHLLLLLFLASDLGSKLFAEKAAAGGFACRVCVLRWLLRDMYLYEQHSGRGTTRLLL